METQRKVLEGVVVSNKMKNTVTVKISKKIKHPRYEKLMETHKKYFAHTDKELAEGQIVQIIQCRPISKMKRWRVI